ncbi:MAG: hypothetical protein ACLR1V_14605 [Coprococcus sp.]
MFLQKGRFDYCEVMLHYPGAARIIILQLPERKLTEEHKDSCVQ